MDAGADAGAGAGAGGGEDTSSDWSCRVTKKEREETLIVTMYTQDSSGFTSAG